MPMTSTKASTSAMSHETAEPRSSNFIRDRILEDLKTNKYQGRVQTRFPPEPNGYLHIGHAKAICLDFGLADEFHGTPTLALTAPTPEKKDADTVDTILGAGKCRGFSGVALII